MFYCSFCGHFQLELQISLLLYQYTTNTIAFSYYYYVKASYYRGAQGKDEMQAESPWRERAQKGRRRGETERRATAATCLPEGETPPRAREDGNDGEGAASGS